MQEVTTYAEPAVSIAPDVADKPIPKDTQEIIKHEGNLCDLFDESELLKHVEKVTAGIADDRESMSHYLKNYDRAIKRAKLLPAYDKKNFPFDDASNVVLPYVLDAALDFNARATPPLLERRDICKIAIYGKDENVIPPEVMQQLEQVAQTQGPEVAQQVLQQIQAQLDAQPAPKQARAERVAEAINYDLTCGIKNWRERQDKAMFLLPLAGMYFKKTYQCPVTNKRKSDLIWPDKLIFDHQSDTFDEAPRKSFDFTMSRNEVVTAVRSGRYKAWDGFDTDTDTLSYEFTETHCDIDLDDDGYAEPYILVLNKSNGRCVSIVRRYEEEDVTMNEKGQVVSIDGESFFSQTIFIPDPAGTCTGMGYGILLGDMFDVIDTNTNQMIDAGTLNNVAANSGFIRRGTKVGPRAGNRQKKGTLEMAMGKFTYLESDGTSPLQNDIAQLPFSGPSESLRMLLEQLKLEAREMTAVSQSIDANPGEAASLYLARLHQAHIKPNSIMVRVYNGLTKEFQRIYDVQRRYMTEKEYMEILDDPAANKEADYEVESYDIKTTADPSQGSELERTARAETFLDRAERLPQVFDLRFAAELWAESIGLDPEKAVPPPQPGQPDPIQLMVAQAQQTMSEAEKMKGTADIMDAQVKMAEVDLKYMKLDIEIEKMESEILKNLSEVDKNQAEVENSKSKLYLDSLKERRELFKVQRDNLKEILNAAEIGATRLAQPPNNQAVPAGLGNGSESGQGGFTV